MKISVLHLYVFGAILSLCSCEKVINIDLKNTTPKIIIEGLITDDPLSNTHTVMVSRSNNFSSDGANKPISGALVVLEDVSAKVKDTLVESVAGTYISSKIKGTNGHVYTLEVTVEGVRYSASSKMPDLVGLDSLYEQRIPAFGNEFKQVIPVFKDPIGIQNFYRFSIQVNDSVQRGYQPWDDLLSDGKTNSRPLVIEEQDLLNGNDTVYVTMNCTDKGMFDFFNTLENASGNGQTPANPTSMFTNGAIGYFGAVTVRTRSLILP